MDLASPPVEKHVILGNYSVHHTIGAGSFSKIKLARDLVTGEEVVLKIIKREHYSTMAVLQREHAIMASLSHPHVMPLLGTIEVENQVILVMPYVKGGDLGSYIIRNGLLTEEQARGVFRQLVAATQYCHARGIAHRDLKPENILLDSLDYVRLCDFGLSHNFKKEPMKGFCGTPAFMAPEVTRRGFYGPEVDIWNLGVILHVMVTGYPPFMPGQYWNRFPLSTDLSFHLRSLLQAMLKENPRKRIGWEQIMCHPWVTLDLGPMTMYVESTHSEPAPEVKPTPGCCLVLLPIFFPRRCQSCPPVLLASLTEENQSQEQKHVSKCNSLPLELGISSSAPLPVPPNTPSTSYHIPVPSADATQGPSVESQPSNIQISVDNAPCIQTPVDNPSCIQISVDNSLSTQSPVDTIPLTQRRVDIAPLTQGPVDTAPHIQRQMSISPRTRRPMSISPRIQRPVDTASRIQRPMGISPRTQRPVDTTPRTQRPMSISPRTQRPMSVSPRTQRPMNISPRVQRPVDHHRRSTFTWIPFRCGIIRRLLNCLLLIWQCCCGPRQRTRRRHVRPL